MTPAELDFFIGHYGVRHQSQTPPQDRPPGCERRSQNTRREKTVVLVYPVDKWVLMLLKATGSEVRNLGDVRWLAIEDLTPGKGTGRHIAAFILRAA